MRSSSLTLRVPSAVEIGECKLPKWWQFDQFDSPSVTYLTFKSARFYYIMNISFTTSSALNQSIKELELNQRILDVLEESIQVLESKLTIICSYMFTSAMFWHPFKRKPRDAGALVGQGGEQESKGICERRQAEKWGSGCIPGKCFGATPFRLA